MTSELIFCKNPDEYELVELEASVASYDDTKVVKYVEFDDTTVLAIVVCVVALEVEEEEDDEDEDEDSSSELSFGLKPVSPKFLIQVISSVISTSFSEKSSFET